MCLAPHCSFRNLSTASTSLGKEKSKTSQNECIQESEANKWMLAASFSKHHITLIRHTYKSWRQHFQLGWKKVSVTCLCLMAFCLPATPEIWTSRAKDSRAPFQRRSLDRQHCSEERRNHCHRLSLSTLCFVQYSDFYSHVSIGGQHISHVSGVGKLPPKDVLYDNDGLVRYRGWLHYIRFDVFYLDLLAEAPIVHPISNVTGTWLGFICHLLADRQEQTDRQTESQLERGDRRASLK